MMPIHAVAPARNALQAPARQSYLYLGLDLGQASDDSALAIAERDRPPRQVGGGTVQYVNGRPVPFTPSPAEPADYALSWLQRFALKTPYPAIVTSVATMVRQLASRQPAPRLALVLDKTGVGAPLLDLFKRERLPGTLVDVTITGGDAVGQDGQSFTVPKRDLVSTCQVLLQGERLKIASALPDAGTLTQELLNFQVKITTTAHDTYGAWREGAHDDLVLATALAVWYGERDFERLPRTPTVSYPNPW